MEQTINNFLLYLDDCLTSSISEELADTIKVIDMEVSNNTETSKIIKTIKENMSLGGSIISSEKMYELLKNVPAFKEVFDHYRDLRCFLTATKDLYEKPIESENLYAFYDTFDILSILINNARFSAREKMDLLFIAIKKVYNDPMNEEFFKNIIPIPDELAELDESLKSVKKIQTFMTNLAVINERYFEKKDSYEENDIKIIIETLQKLEIEINLCNIIENLLLKEMKKRNKKTEKVEIKSGSKNLSKKSNLLTDKEYKAIKKELRSYFDFYNVEKVKELNNDEIMRCIELLIKIDSPTEEIRRFVRVFEKEQSEYEQDTLIDLEGKNIISVYIELYNKLKFYEKKLGIEDNLNYISDCLQEMFMCSLEDYIFYKGEIETELRKILVLLPQTYEYEIKETEKRIKFEK